MKTRLHHHEPGKARKLIFFLFLFILSLSISLFSYSKEKSDDIILKGSVSDKTTGDPIPGVSISVKGTSNGVLSDSKGNFSLTLPANSIVIVSYVGYIKQEINILSNHTLAISLQADLKSLNEVVVVGYGTRKKSDLTGAVARVKASQLEDQHPSNVQDVLKGNIAGINVGFDASAKGASSLQVRGQGSLTGGTSPLYVVDGVIYPGQLSDINPTDIETIDVLKDASSAAVYGAKAANGVVIVTTKKGSNGKPIVTVNTNVGVAVLEKNQRPFDPAGFMAYREQVLNSQNANHKQDQFSDPRTLPSSITTAQWLAYDNSTGDPVDVWLRRLKFQPIELLNYKAGKTTNWYKQIFHNGLRQDHTVSLSGKKDDVSYYMSVNYINNHGVVVGDNYSNIRTRLNLEAKAAKFFTAGLNFQFAARDESSVPVDWASGIFASPYGSKYKDDGSGLRQSTVDDPGGSVNPFLDNYYTDRLNRYYTLFSSLYAKGTLPYGFSYQVNFSPELDNHLFLNHQSALHPVWGLVGGLATRLEETTYNWQLDNILRWNKTFGGVHEFEVTLLQNAEKYQYWSNQIDNQGFQPNDNLGYHNIGAGVLPVVKSNDEYSTGNALMARMNYGFKHRYLLTLTIRRDGYSAFGQKHPYGTFPSAAVGWVFTDENFMKHASWLQYGKLRFSYGLAGNRDIGRYQAISDLSTSKYLNIQPDGTVLQVTQLYTDRMPNPDLKWEKTTAFNLGLDFTVLKGRLSGSVDLYKRLTSDLLVQRSLPNITGFSSVTSNLGKVENKGVELSLNSTNISSKNFSWLSTFNFSLNRNRIIHLYGAVNVYDAQGNVTGKKEYDDIGNKWFIGHDIGAIWDLKTVGVWQQKDAALATTYGLNPGDFRVQDVNNDGKYSDADRQFLGYTTPRFSWSLRNEFKIYKNFNFSFLIYSNWGMKQAFNISKNNAFLDRGNNYNLPYWTPTNPINNYARLTSSAGGATYNVYQDASFIRLSNVALSYTFQSDFLHRLKLQSLKVYVNATNPAVYAPHWNYWDVENQGPTPSYYQLGLNISL